MLVLILYSKYELKERMTVDQHLYSFKRYDKNNKYFYINVTSDCVIPSFLEKIHFDLIIFHYTFLAAERFLECEEKWIQKISGVEKLKGFKIAMPQDEMDNSDRLCNFFKNSKIDAVGTCYYKPEDIALAYPYEKSGVNNFFEVFTGYVDEQVINKLGYIRELKDRPIDIGYRARKLAPNFGIHAQLKYELLRVFEKELKGSDLIYDLNNTNNTYSDEDKTLVKLGNEWFEFLMNCKSFLGCEGGSSLLDADGQIRVSVNNYLSIHPEASFEEVEEACFKGKDNSISLFALSPRHFEAAMTKTLQILVEGYYGGVFIPGKHYVEVKKGFSNLKEVLEKLNDIKKCQEIVENCYNDIVLSQKYTYREFVQYVISKVPNKPKKRFFLKSFFISLILKIYILFRELNFKMKFYLFDFYVLLIKIYHKYLQKIFRKYIKPLLIKLKII